MRRLDRLRELSSIERQLLLASTLCVAATAIGLRVLGFDRVRWLLRHLAKKERGPDPTFPPATIAWAVSAAARHLPGRPACLAQSLATQVILARHGYDSEIRFGVARQAGQLLEAHAWVEHQGAVLQGGADSPERFVSLVTPKDVER